MFFSLGQLLILLADMLIVSSEQCKSGMFHVNPDKLNRKLVGYDLKIRTFENISPRGCFDKCIRRPRCHSYNYNRQLLRCELNNQPTPDSVHNFLNEVGFIYVEVNHYRGDPLFDTCLENSCKPGEICEENKDGSVFCVKDQEGNKCLNILTRNGSYTLRIELVNQYSSTYHIEYSAFAVDDAASAYILTVYGASGTLSNYMANSNGYPFTTDDRDNDNYGLNCAKEGGYGSWWHNSCTDADLNNDDNNCPSWGHSCYTKSYMMIKRNN